MRLNQTPFSGATNDTSTAQIVLWLSPRQNNAPVNFNVVASFGGYSVSTATATMTTLNGISHVVCTTTQYNFGSAVGYEPNSNSTTLTVIPQSTDTTTVTKTSEEMEQTRLQMELWN